MSDIPLGEYPEGFDVEWVAVDRHGRIGVFTTAGEGPLPRVYVVVANFLDRVTAAIEALPIVSDYELLCDVPRPDDFIAAAQRGLFSFDWTDVHRGRDSLGAYEVRVRPKAPVSIATPGVPPELVALLESVASDALDFDADVVDVVAALACDGLPPRP